MSKRQGCGCVLNIKGRGRKTSSRKGGVKIVKGELKGLGNKFRIGLETNKPMERSTAWRKTLARFVDPNQKIPNQGFYLP